MYLVAGYRVYYVQGLWQDETINLVFDNFNHYEYYSIYSDDFWTPSYNGDLSELTRRGPAATTNPTTCPAPYEPAGGR
jgi:hypothetical protein